jgi:hypothetical protein
LDPETHTLIPGVDSVVRHVWMEKGCFAMDGMASKLAAIKF